MFSPSTPQGRLALVLEQLAGLFSPCFFAEKRRGKDGEEVEEEEEKEEEEEELAFLSGILTTHS